MKAALYISMMMLASCSSIPTDTGTPSTRGETVQKQQSKAAAGQPEETATRSNNTGLLAVVPAKKKGGVFGRSVLPDVEGDFKSIVKDESIAVPVFKVTFGKQFNASKRQESGRWTSSDSATVRGQVNVQGFREAVLQRITNAAYEDLIQRLKAKGLTVLSKEAMLAKSPELKKAARDQHYPAVEDDESEYLASGTMYPSGMMSVDGQSGRLTRAPSDIFSELKSGIVAVNYFLDFVAVKAEGKSRVGFGSDSVTASLAFGPVANVSGFIQSFGFKEGGCAPIGGCSGPQSSAQLQQVAYSTIPFGSLKDASTSGDTTINVVSGVLGLLGGSSSVSSSTYELTVDEVEFVKASIDALKKANEKLLGVM